MKQWAAEHRMIAYDAYVLRKVNFTFVGHPMADKITSNKHLRGFLVGGIEVTKISPTRTMNELKKAIRDKKWLQPIVDDDPRKDPFQAKFEKICSGGSAQPM